MSSTFTCVAAIKAALSATRISTYEAATAVTTPDDPKAIALYAWNAQVSAAMLAPLHICEVVVRNAVADALDSVYGPNWPWVPVFRGSLPRQGGYSPRSDLDKVASQQPTTGKVIPELKFAFWEHMFTKRHDIRLWNGHIKRVFPEHPPSMTVRDLRKRIYQDLGVLRSLRNRIAHHEPIFTRNLSGELARMVELVRMRSTLVESWMVANQQASALILQTPVFRGGARWTPSHEEIELKAYQLWVEAGSPNDTAEADWFAARKLFGCR